MTESLEMKILRFKHTRHYLEEAVKHRQELWSKGDNLGERWDQVSSHIEKQEAMLRKRRTSVINKLREEGIL